MENTTHWNWLRTLLRILGSIIAWAWAIVAGGGGLGLIITRGPLPLTNGWFALFSGLAACPLTAWLLKKYARITLPGWARFVIALLIIMLGRLVLKLEGRGDFLPRQ
jgi:TctA family transporter